VRVGVPGPRAEAAEAEAAEAEAERVAELVVGPPASGRRGAEGTGAGVGGECGVRRRLRCARARRRPLAVGGWRLPDAWIDISRRDPKDGEVGLVGYEINFNRYFYRYTPPRPVEEIEGDIRAIEGDILRMLAEVTGGAA
jgi:hypothetical protein